MTTIDYFTFNIQIWCNSSTMNNPLLKFSMPFTGRLAKLAHQLAKIKLSVVSLALGLLLWTTLGVLPILDQSIVAAKYTLILFSGALILTVYLLRSFNKGTLSFIKTPFTIPVSLFAVVTLISIIANNRYPVESFLGFGGIYLALAIFTLTGSLLVKSQASNTQKLLNILGVITIVLLITTFLQRLGYGPSRLLNQLFALNLPNDNLFNLAGSNLVALQITLVTIAGFATTAILRKKVRLWEKVVLVALALSIVFYGWMLRPNQPTTPIILTPVASWSVAVNSLKNFKVALLGVGPDNYLQAFNLHRPQWLNSTGLWSVQYSQSFNLPTSIVVSLGALGLVAWIWLVVNLIKQTKKIDNRTKPIQMMLLMTILVQLVLPLNIILLTIQAILLVFWVGSEKDRLTVYSLNLKGLLSRIKPLANYSNLIIKALIGLLVIGSFALWAGIALASYSSFLMYQATQATSSNHLIKAYNFQQQAIGLNPYLDTNRRRNAVTNLMIASALSQKADLTDDDRAQFAQLIQQAIREAKAATILDSHDVANWQTLGQVYQTLVGVAEGAEQWTFQAYSEAVRLAPSHPDLRITLGGVLLNTKQYQEALSYFEQAALLKPDYANAYYNGANALKLLQRFDEAKAAYQKTLLLLAPDSEEYLKTAEELQALEQIAKQVIVKKTTEGSESTEQPVVNPALTAPILNEATPPTSPAPLKTTSLNAEPVIDLDPNATE